MGDGDALGLAGGTGGEDDPCVVVRPGTAADGAAGLGARGDREVLADDGAHLRLGEDQPGAFLGVLGVDRHIGGARGEHGEDRHVQVGGARGHPYAHPVAGADAGLRQTAAQALGRGGQGPVAQRRGAVVDGGCGGVRPGGGGQDPEQGAPGGGVAGPEDRPRGAQDAGGAGDTGGRGVLEEREGRFDEGHTVLPGSDEPGVGGAVADTPGTLFRSLTARDRRMSNPPKTQDHCGAGAPRPAGRGPRCPGARDRPRDWRTPGIPVPRPS